jgi:hypothetical protein
VFHASVFYMVDFNQFMVFVSPSIKGICALMSSSPSIKLLLPKDLYMSPTLGGLNIISEFEPVICLIKLASSLIEVALPVHALKYRCSALLIECNLFIATFSIAQISPTYIKSRTCPPSPLIPISCPVKARFMKTQCCSWNIMNLASNSSVLF